MKSARISITIILSLFIIFQFGCGKTTEQNNATDQSKIQIVTTIFPLYDFANQIGGEYVHVKSLIPAGVDPHHYEPSPKDMIELNNAKLFIYNGAGYEAWIEKVTQNMNQEKTKVVNASLGLELLTGQHDHDDHATEENEHDHDEHATEEEHDHGDFDPHVWLDPMNAKQQAALVLDALIELAPEHKDVFQSNFDRLANELDQLDAEYEAAFAKKI